MQERIAEISAFMLSIMSDHVDGYNRLDTESLVAEANFEMGTTANSLELEIALKRVQEYRQRWN